MRFFIVEILLHLALLVASAQAEQAPAADPSDYPYCCVGDLRNGDCGGSATLVGIWKAENKGLVISCAHCFSDGVSRPTVRFGEHTYPAKVLSVNSRIDLSAMMIDRPEGVRTVWRVRAAKPSDGVLLAVGYPWYSRNGCPHFTTGKYLGYSGTDVQFKAKPYLHSGFSGGGLFAPDGSYLGSTNGYGDSYSYAASGQAMVNFVGRWLKVDKE